MAQAGIVLAVEAREAEHPGAGASRWPPRWAARSPTTPICCARWPTWSSIPLAIRGAFDQDYLRLPDAVLLAVMRKHQRYLPVLREGKLLPYFITIANGPDAGCGRGALWQRRGAARALCRRRLFLRRRHQASAGGLHAGLATLTFQERLGSVLDKVGRISAAGARLGDLLGLARPTRGRRSPRRCAVQERPGHAVGGGADLAAGQMGRHYAELAGESAAVAQAIEQHYWPRYMGDKLPQSRPAVAVGLADRLDTLVGLFAVGIRPSGAADPWGLRRAALSLMQLLLGKGDLAGAARGVLAGRGGLARGRSARRRCAT